MSNNYLVCCNCGKQLEVTEDDLPYAPTWVCTSECYLDWFNTRVWLPYLRFKHEEQKRAEKLGKINTAKGTAAVGSTEAQDASRPRARRDSEGHQTL